jgi:hypothetical protein
MKKKADFESMVLPPILYNFLQDFSLEVGMKLKR